MKFINLLTFFLQLYIVKEKAVKFPKNLASSYENSTAYLIC
ncbi:hypothetical protein appser6_13960 [Actinobacillus pleuropneumoniae serovar 6 str. Femo]|uniref:Uncharacterized protein n=1 Tax=Actinobacillus pleuropneumoniae serovar 6 str. Femo TaxID=754256 RepID=A0A828PSV0_ACTPL|nr:hypothetical protein appser2_12530 [Actinobacillus pleuropneumoniae serovar 2 str. S1536]EFM91697.1 hypothetical protein appser6_13960 [Actinobacillus pleuropneumoniae serovar 6 str. Femo]EFM96067.1 hypothetical protein appser10_13020 [Actinobacillus pleuropneumoniae serovar 10 str. D13039]